MRRVATHYVTEMIISGTIRHLTDRRRKLPCSSGHPLTSLGSTVYNSLELNTLGGIAHRKIIACDVADASALVQHILAVGLVIGTSLWRISDDSDVFPFRRVPVRVVVTLLRALIAIPVAVWVLPSVNG